MNKFKTAFIGLAKVLKDKSVMIQVILMVIAIIAFSILKISYLEWLVVIICFGVVISAEIFNTCIERLCDKITKEKDEGIAYIKDIAAGAVLVTALVSLCIALFIIARRLS